MQFIARLIGCALKHSGRSPGPLISKPISAFNNTVQFVRVQRFSGAKDGGKCVDSTIVNTVRDALSCSHEEAAEFCSSNLECQMFGSAQLTKQIFLLQEHGISTASIMKHPFLFAVSEGKYYLRRHLSLL